MCVCVRATRRQTGNPSGRQQQQRIDELCHRPNSHELLAIGVAIEGIDQHTVQAGSFGTHDVDLGDVPRVHGVLRRDPKAPQRQMKDRRIGLL